MESTTVVARLARHGTPAESRAIQLAPRYGGSLVHRVPNLVIVFGNPMDALAYSAALVDDTSPDPSLVAIGVGGTGAGAIAEEAGWGQVLAASRVESSTRGRLACGLSFSPIDRVPSAGGGIETFHRLLVPGVHERLGEVE